MGPLANSDPRICLESYFILPERMFLPRQLQIYQSPDPFRIKTCLWCFRLFLFINPFPLVFDALPCPGTGIIGVFYMNQLGDIVSKPDKFRGRIPSRHNQFNVILALFHEI